MLCFQSSTGNSVTENNSEHWKVPELPQEVSFRSERQQEGSQHLLGARFWFGPGFVPHSIDAVQHLGNSSEWLSGHTHGMYSVNMGGTAGRGHGVTKGGTALCTTGTSRGGRYHAL